MRNQYKVLEEKYEVVQEAILKPDQEFNYWKDRIKTVVSSFKIRKKIYDTADVWFYIKNINRALNRNSNSMVSVTFEDLRNIYPGVDPAGTFIGSTDKSRIYLNQDYLFSLFSNDSKIQKRYFNFLMNTLYHELVHLYQYFWIKGFPIRGQNDQSQKSEYIKNYFQNEKEIMAHAAFFAREILDRVQNDRDKAIEFLRVNAQRLTNKHPEPVKKKVLRYTYDYINHLSRNTGEEIQTPVGIQTT